MDHYDLALISNLFVFIILMAKVADKWFDNSGISWELFNSLIKYKQ